jgi:hypothetical protein
MDAIPLVISQIGQPFLFILIGDDGYLVPSPGLDKVLETANFIHKKY